jgi:hypothetical protein
MLDNRWTEKRDAKNAHRFDCAYHFSERSIPRDSRKCGFGLPGRRVRQYTALRLREF